MANAVNYALELHNIRSQFLAISADPWLSDSAKLALCRDINRSMPARAICGQCGVTHDILTALMNTALEDMRNAAVPKPTIEPVVVESAAPKAKAKAKPKRKVKSSKK